VFGITDPVNGYEQAVANAQPGTTVVDIPDGDGGQFVVVDDDVDAGGTPVVLDTPIDQTVVESATPTATWASHPLNHRGLIPGHRVVYLQRLADPTRPFDTNRNPYRIVDSSAVDLYVFNGFEDDEAAQTNPSVEDAPARDTLSTYERSEENNPDQHAQRRLWKTGVLGQFNPLQPSGGGVTMSNAVTHLANLQFQHTLGEVNEFYVNHDGSAGGGAPQPFAWLPWNNRPFANRYELVNVPYTSAAWLTRVFDTRGGGGDTYSASNHGSVAELVRDRDRLKRVFHPNAAAFPHLLNFEADSLQSDRLQQIFDFVEVPSRFAGVHEFVNTTGRDREELDDDAAEIDFGYRLSAPFDELSTFRYPGKVNLNTVFAPQVWNALLGTRSQTDNGSGQRDSATAGPYASKVDFPTWRSTIAESPMRPAVAANYRSGGVPGAANTGLLRSSDGERDPGSGAGGETDYLLAFHEPANAFNNTDRNAYFRNGLRQRLGGVATNRSSVFAIWVTVGYFEWNQETGDLRDKGSGGVEYGEEDGTVQRSRGFYLFDRSIPMAYEPGENHNVDRGVLLRSFIE
jgi:hypothetical protein